MTTYIAYADCFLAAEADTLARLRAELRSLVEGNMILGGEFSVARVDAIVGVGDEVPEGAEVVWRDNGSRSVGERLADIITAWPDPKSFKATIDGHDVRIVPSGVYEDDIEEDDYMLKWTALVDEPNGACWELGSCAAGRDTDESKIERQISEDRSNRRWWLEQQAA